MILYYYVGDECVIYHVPSRNTFLMSKLGALVLEDISLLKNDIKICEMIMNETESSVIEAEEVLKVYRESFINSKLLIQ